MLDGFGFPPPLSVIQSRRLVLFLFTFLFPFVLVRLFQVKMSQLVKGEKGSCLQLYKKQQKLYEDMCPPCIFLASKERKYHKVHKTATVGVCYLLHPRPLSTPQAVEEEHQDNTTTRNSNEARRQPLPASRFVAEPANNARMHKDKPILPRRRERPRHFSNLDVMSQCQEVAKEVETNPEFLQTLMDNHPEIAKPAAGLVVQTLKQSVSGKRKLMEAVTGKDNISLPGCGTSKAANNKRIKTCKDLKTGLKLALGTPVVKTLCRLPWTPATPATPALCIWFPLTPATEETRAPTPLHPNGNKVQQRAKQKQRVNFQLKTPPMALQKPALLPRSTIHEENLTAPSNAEVPPSCAPPLFLQDTTPNSKALPILTESPSEFENPTFVNSPSASSSPTVDCSSPLDPIPSSAPVKTPMPQTPRTPPKDESPSKFESPPMVDGSSLLQVEDKMTAVPIVAAAPRPPSAKEKQQAPMRPHTTPRTPKEDVGTKKMSRTKKRKPTSSAKKRRKSKTFDLQQEGLRAAIGDSVLSHVTTLSQPRERRPWLAAGAARGHRRKTVEAVFGIHISHDEWRLIKIHAVYPGPFVEAKRKHVSRNKVDTGILVKLLRFLDLPGNLQKYAFGRKIVGLFNHTSYEELDNVARMKKLKRLAAEFVCVLSSEMDNINQSEAEPGVAPVPESDKRCQHLEQATFRRCMCPRGHTENHKFTPKGSICLVTAMELINSLSFTEIKRLTGLDDVKVSKGRENFEQMRQLAKIYCQGVEQYKSMEARIDEHELFCQTDLMTHYRKVGDHCCNCLTCGFLSESKSRNCVFAVAIPVSEGDFGSAVFV
jgi:hypothetical protein